MDRLRLSRRLLSRPGCVSSLRLIYSKTGEWPSTDEELNHATRKEVDAFWKDKYKRVSEEPLHHEEDSGSQQKKYVLSMFPYPSGKLHLGHVRVYATGDTMARFYRHRGYKVIHPIGWDAFGLPAENAAIDRGEMPERWTHTNIQQMKEQLQELGCSFDWHRELSTCDPQYYRWTQWIFLRLFRAGLAYQEKALVNWDPVDQTVVANEQVDDQGRSWRSGAKVEQQYLRQWYIKTTRFSKSLLDGLSDPMLENWRDIIKIQRHWIGDCDGYRVEMAVESKEPSGSENNHGVKLDARLTLWMPQPELLHGVTFIGIRHGHALDTEANKSSCHGPHELLNIHAVCPISSRKIPVIVSESLPYLEDTDTYVGIACISEHDTEVSSRCGFPVKHILLENGKLVNSGDLSGLRCDVARKLVTKRLLELNAGGFLTSAKLKDWLISRQRYWGTPIPIIHCPTCGPVPVPEDELPVKLPSITHFPKRGVSPLKAAHDWLNCLCPRCGEKSQRETDTMDTFVDSSWYFLRYLDNHNTQEAFRYHLQDTLMPVDLYIGGKEHAVLHMLYARCIQHFLASEGLVSHWEPFKKLVMMGMVVAPTYRVKGTGHYLTRDQVDFSVTPPVQVGTGTPLVITDEKMSKSKYNGVDPQEVLDKYGMDTTRLLMLANFAPNSPRTWSEEIFPGILSWQNRLWMTVGEFIKTRRNTTNITNTLSTEERQRHEKDMWETRNYSLSSTTYIMDQTHQLNAAISFMQALTTTLRKVPRVMMLSEAFEQSLATQIIMLAPLTPHFASELWAGFCSVATSPSVMKDKPLMEQSWPEVDQEYPLPLKYVLIGDRARQVKVARKVLDNLTPDQALEIVSGQKDFQEHLESREVLETTLKILPGIRASVFFKFKILDADKAWAELQKKNTDRKKQKMKKKTKKQAVGESMK